MVLVKGPTGKLLKGPGGDLAGSTNCCCGDCVERCAVEELDITIPTLTLCGVDVSGGFIVPYADTIPDTYCRICSYGGLPDAGVVIEAAIMHCDSLGTITVTVTVYPEVDPECTHKWVKEYSCEDWCDAVNLGELILEDVTELELDDLIILLEGECCCYPTGGCDGCCLPVNEECHETCGEEGRPEIYLDVDITGTTCGELSFTHLPYSEAASTSFEGCIAFECGNNPLDSGEYAGPSSGNAYTIGAVTSDCETCGDAIEELCTTYDGCIYWVLYFSVACEMGEDGNPTGRYHIRFSYRHDLQCVYDYSVLYDEGEGPYDSYDYDLTIDKCMATDGELDMTFEIVRGVTEEPVCANGLCETRTFTFRIYTDPPPP